MSNSVYNDKVFLKKKHMRSAGVLNPASPASLLETQSLLKTAPLLGPRWNRCFQGVNFIKL